ncbi:MAG TPA: autotransporter-associated beta strand repeat-containing protein [Saprospiraceae bacterium]|nr:autotransporter-associated beta strand repeat-containing protein [Saprospiraceae bacterium]
MKTFTHFSGFSILHFHHSRLRHLVIFMMVLVANFLSVHAAFTQTTGDYRSVADGNWTVLTTWQRWDGSAWLTPTAPQGYPGQNTGTQTVTIQNDNQVALNVSPFNSVEYLVIGSSVANANTDLTFAGPFNLYVNWNVTILATNGGDNTKEILINAGNLNIAEHLYIGSGGQGDDLPGRVSRLIITTGSVTVFGNVTLNTFSATSDPAQAQIVMSGAAGNFNLKRNLILNNNVGTLIPGTTSTFTFNGFVDQSIAGGSSINYNHVVINKTFGSVAFLTAATTMSGLLNLISGDLNLADFNLTLGSLTGSANITNTTGGTTPQMLTIGSDNSTPGTYSGNISDGTNTGGIALTKTGTGTLTLSGTNAYSGITTVTNGLMLLNSAGALPGVTGVAGGTSNLTINGGIVGLGAGDFTRGLGTGLDQVQWTAGVSGGFAAFGANRLVNIGGASGTLTWGTAPFLTTTPLILGATTATHTVDFQNPIDLNLAIRTIQAEDGLAATDATMSGVISGLTAGVTKTGAGLMKLTNTNTFNGAVTISSGILSVSAVANTLTNSPLGSGAATATISIGATGTLQYTGSGSSTNRSITATANGATLDASGSGTFSLNGGVTGATRNVVFTGTGVGSMNSVISTTTGTVTKTGTGLWIYSANNTYTGSTTISTGTFKIGFASERINNASQLIVNGTFDMGGFNETVTSLAGSGIVTSTATGNSVLTTNGTASTTFSGVIQNGSATSLAFVKTGNSILTMAGNNTHSGSTTINTTSTIRLGANNALSNNSQIIFVAGTFSTGSPAGFSDTIGTISLNTTGTIALGTGVHTITVSNSSGVTWAGTTLTITGWTGLGGTSGVGTSGKIMVGVGGLTATQLSKINFSGFFGFGALITASGELVPNTMILYSQVSGSPNLNSNWNTMRDGTGISGENSDFSDGYIFVIQGTGNGGTTPHTMTTSGTWAVTGAGSSVRIENGATLASPSAITFSTSTFFIIDNGGTYKHQNTIAPALVFQGVNLFAPSGTVEFNNGSSPYPSGITFGNLTINFAPAAVNSIFFTGLTINGDLNVLNTNATEFAIAGNTSTLNVGGSINVSGGTLNVSSGTGISTINVKGNFSHTGGTIKETGSGSGIFVFNGITTQTYTSGGTLSGTINYQVNTGSVLQMGTGTVPAIISNGSNGTFTLQTGATLGITSPLGITSSGANGNIQLTGARSFSTTANYIYNGTIAQATGNGLPASASLLKIDNSAGVTLSGNVTATTLDLTNGLLHPSTFNIIIPSAGSILNASSTSYVNGKLNRIYDAIGSKTFPIGSNGNYRPITFEYTTVPAGSSTVSATQVEPASMGVLPANNILFTERHWLVTQSGFTNAAFTYNISLDGTGFTPTGPARILKDDAGTVNSFAATFSSPYYTTTGLTTLSKFALGYICNGPDVPTISVSPSATVCSGTTVTLNIATGALNEATNWQWFSGSCGGPSAGSGTSIMVSPGSTTSYFVRGEGGCVTPGSCASQTITTVNSGTWTGTTSTDWHTSTNWCGDVPTLPTNVIIPPGGNQPIIGAAAICNDLTLTAGATLSIVDAITLSVGGNISGTGTQSGLGKVLMTGANSKTLSGVSLGNFEIDMNKDVTLTGAPTVTGDFILAGYLHDAGFTMAVGGNISGGGIHDGAGKILMNGSSKTISTITLGNLELDNAVGFSLLGHVTLSTLNLAPFAILNVNIPYVLTVQ